MIAVVRNQDADGLRGFQDRRARRHGNLTAFDRQVHHRRVGGGSSHQATIAGTACTVLRVISASNSPRNFCSPETTGAAHESLNTQIVLPVMSSARLISVSKSSMVPSPATMRSRIFVVHAVPSRHCVHWAQLSCA